MADYTLNFEINNNHLKFLEVSREKEGLCVHSCGFSAYDGLSKTKIYDSIKHSLSSKSPSEKTVTLSVWSPHLIVRRVVMPVMSAAELKSAIRFEFEKHIPFSVDDCFLEHYIIRKLAANARMEVMLIAVKKESVEQRRKKLVESGFGINFVDVHPFALTNAFNHMHSQDRTKNVALVHLSELCRDSKYAFSGPNFVSIVKDGQPFVVRDLGEDSKASDVGAPEDVMGRINSAVKQSIEYFENTAEEGIQKVYISGRAADSEKYIKHLEKTIDLKAESWVFTPQLQFGTPVCRDEFVKSQQDYHVLLGLAIRGLYA